MKKSDLINGSKLYYINHETKKEQYAVYSYGKVIFCSGTAVEINNYSENLKYKPNNCYDVIRVELPKEYEILKSEEIEKLELVGYEEFKTMTSAERYSVTAIEYDKINELIDEINRLKKEGRKNA